MKSTLRNVLIFLAILLLLACAWYFRSIVVYILVAGVLSIMGRPLVDLICKLRIKKWYLPRPVGALITLIVIWGGIV
ncbi:MAG: AI-2E family transporter, partial [Bacteroidales bacterium]|nr:AI-2E family transporter [Bacteroidales bacterium]